MIKLYEHIFFDGWIEGANYPTAVMNREGISVLFSDDIVKLLRAGFEAGYDTAIVENLGHFDEDEKEGDKNGN